MVLKRKKTPAQGAAADERPVEQRIRERAYELFLESGCQHGNDTQHWLQAESEVLATQAGTQPQNGKQT